MTLNGSDINILDDVQAAFLVNALHKRLQQRTEREQIVTKQSKTVQQVDVW
jgi:hypothetical protein